MTRHLAATLIILGISLQILAQPHAPKFFHRHLTGKIDKNTTVVVNMIRVNDSLYGDYCYTVTGQGSTASALKYPESSKMFFGKITTSGNFWIKTWPGDKGPLFKGIFKDDRQITGTWVSEAVTGKLMPVQLNESYPAGSLPFNLWYEEGSQKLTGEARSPQAEVKLGLLLPATSGTAGNDTLRKVILASFTEMQNNPGSPENILAGIKQDYFKDYLVSNKVLYQEMPGASFSWELLKFTHIIYNAGYRVTFSILTYSFTGGAHGLETETFTTVDLQAGKITRLGDLLKAGYENELTRMLTGKLHRMINLPESRKLSESGYFTDEIKPTDNFYLNENGIGFFYNRYEIAPYAFGPTDVFLTKEELKQLLK